MPVFPLAPPPVAPPAPISGVPAQDRFEVTQKPFLGFGLTRPFRRDRKTDFASAGGLAGIQACVGQILATPCSTDQAQGEIPWRPEFGSRLHQLRHQNNNDVLAGLAHAYAIEALQRWEPRVRLKATSVSKESTPGGGENVLAIGVVYDVIDVNVDGNQVVVRDVTQQVSL